MRKALFVVIVLALLLPGPSPLLASEINIPPGTNTFPAPTVIGPTNISQDAGQSRDPAIVSDPSGNIHVVWRNDTGTTAEILYRRWNGSAWSQTEKLAQSAASGPPAVAADKAGNVHVFWIDGGPAYAGLMYRRWNGTAWSTVQNITPNQGSSIAAATDSNNNVHIVYISGESGLVYQRWDGTSWSAPTKFMTELSWVLGSSIAVDPVGNVHVAAWDSATSSEHVVYSRWNGRVWSQPENISDNFIGNAWNPAIGADASGNVYVVWQDESGAASNPEIFYRRWNGGVWSQAENISQTPGLSWFPAAGVDPQGALHAVWADYDIGATQMQILHKGYAGGVWSQTEVLTQANTGFPKAAVDPSGNLHVVWKATVSGNDEIFYLQRPASSQPPGQLQLAAGWNLISLPTPQLDPSLSSVLTDVVAVTKVFLFENNVWMTAYRSSPGWSGNLTQMVDGKAYWLYSSGAVTLTLKPKPPSIPSYLLAQGWNMIGSSSTAPVDAYLSPLQGNWSAIYRYDASSGWETAKPGALGFSQIEPGRGYWLQLQSPGILRNNYFIPTRLSFNPRYPTTPSVASDSGGNAYVVWQDYPEIGASDVLLRRWNGTNWSQPENISQDPTSSETPSVAVDLKGNVHVVWNDDNQGDTQVLYRRWDGLTWSPVEKVSQTNGTQFPSVAVDFSGDVHVVWDGDMFTSPKVVHRRKAAGNWLAIDVVGSFAAGFPNVTVAADPGGNVYLVSASGGPEPSVSLSRWNGSSFVVQAVPAKAARSTSYRVLGDNDARVGLGKNGTMHVLWQGVDMADIWYSYWDGKAWSPAEALAHSIAGQGMHYGTPVVSADGFDSAHVLWDNNGEVYYIRRDLVRP